MNPMDQLDDLEFAATRDWLKAALLGQRDLPRLSPDEPAHVAILRGERTLEKQTRRDLERACQDLVEEFLLTPEADFDYLNSMLYLAVGYELNLLAPLLMALARRFPSHASLSTRHKKLILAVLIDLKEPLPVPFWKEMLALDPNAFAGFALSGLLASNRVEGVAAIANLPDRQSIADAAAVILSQTAATLPAQERQDFFSGIKAILPRASLTVRASIEEWLTTAGELSTKRPTDYGKLKAVFIKRDSDWQPKPAPARLCA